MDLSDKTNINFIKEEVVSDKPFLPFNQKIFEIPKNLPDETIYKINIENNSEKPIGEKVEILISTINNIIEVLSFLTLRQLPELKETILEDLDKIKTVIKQDTSEEHTNTIKYEDTEEFDAGQEESSSRKKIKIVLPLRIT